MPGISVNRPILASLLALTLGACGGGGDGGGGNGGGFTQPPASSQITVSGTVSYEFVPPNPGCAGLNFSATVLRPIRGATVVLLNGSGAEMARMSSSDAGAYSFANVNANTPVQIRVLAESKVAAAASWDVEIRDNFDTSAGAPPLLARPMYSMESSVFTTGSNDTTRNLTAATGWSLANNSYTSARVAAPFAILDTIYESMQFILEADPDLVFPPVDVFWSANNSLKNSSLDLYDPDEVDAIDSGELGGSFYLFGTNVMLITGDAVGEPGVYPSDTDEFDAHIVAHEWGHYLDDNIFRSDSPGGTHRIGERADSRLAWGEGWATALASMILDDPTYCDSGLPGTSGGFEINAEGGPLGGQGF